MHLHGLHTLCVLLRFWGAAAGGGTPAGRCRCLVSHGPAVGAGLQQWSLRDTAHSDTAPDVRPLSSLLGRLTMRRALGVKPGSSLTRSPKSCGELLFSSAVVAVWRLPSLAMPPSLSRMRERQAAQKGPSAGADLAKGGGRSMVCGRR